MKQTKINTIWKENKDSGRVCVKGWIRTIRHSKTFSFIEMNDGSCLTSIQIIADDCLPNYSEVASLSTGSAVSVTGDLCPSPGKGQHVEIRADDITIFCRTPETYPLQKKRHSDEFLRSIAHLRPRSNKYGAMFRIRSHVSMFVHQFFQDQGFFYIHTPIITGSDCEGAGEMFRVTTLPPNGPTDPSGDFFGKETGLTVSGQLSAEMFALSLGDVYTFGPTFRAENSNTSRHAAEFWMIEPEMAFRDLTETMDMAERFVKDVVRRYLTTCEEDYSLFARFVAPDLPEILNTIDREAFARITYKDAVDLLHASGRSFEFPVSFGSDLQSEHERYLAESHFKKPVFIYHYPKNIKPFYMRVNDDQTTVAAMDLLVPHIGELIGGSQREERLDILIDRMKDCGLSEEDYGWYLDSRRYGSVPHSGFGLGFERLLMLLTGVSNIRDVIPFPRTPGHIDF
ncbi:asparagine--tRNA ligase [Desulfatiferula olefinivorans]